MSTAALARVIPFEITDEMVELIKVAIARDATDEELKLFIMTCKRLKLDPFARQIFLVKRWDNMLKRKVATVQVSIDGFRLIAERTDSYRGQTVPEWCGPDGKWVDVWLSDQPPAAARVGVHREGFREPLVRTALWRAYAQYGEKGLTAMWSTHGVNQLLKCAEALALRAAFPNDLSGIYTLDELPAEAEAGRTMAAMDVTPSAPANTQTKRDVKPPKVIRASKGPATLEDFIAMDPNAQRAPVAVKENPRSEEQAIDVEGDVVYDSATGEVLPVPAPEPAEPAQVRAMPVRRPNGSCPVFASGSHKGKAYLDTPIDYLQLLLGNNWAKNASPHQLEWARYSVYVQSEKARLQRE